MPDLSELQAAGQVKIIGQDSNGTETSPVGATNQALHTTLKDQNGNQIGIEANPIFTRNSPSSVPSVDVVGRKVVFAGQAEYFSQLISAQCNIKEFSFGGRGIGEGILAKYVDATEIFSANGTGNFESSGDVTLWPETGQFALTTKDYSTAQFFTGAGSMRWIFSKSDVNNYPESTYSFSTPFDASVWRYISARFYQSPSTGATATRTASVVLTSGTAKRFYSIVIATDTVAGWNQIKIEIEKPSSETGTGFDVQNINSISVRMVDGGNKTGTVYWDTIQFIGAISIIQKLYTPGQTVRVPFDPVKVFNAGETMLLIIKNNDTAVKEFQITAAGVNI